MKRLIHCQKVYMGRWHARWGHRVLYTREWRRCRSVRLNWDPCCRSHMARDTDHSEMGNHIHMGRLKPYDLGIMNAAGAPIPGTPCVGYPAARPDHRRAVFKKAS